MRILAWLAACLTALALAGLASAHHEPVLTPDEVAAWAEDLNALVAGIERVHPDHHARSGAGVFEAVVADVLASLPGMTRTQALLGAARIANDLDGHSFFAVEQPGASFGMAPLWLYDFDDGLFVVEAQEPYRSLIGLEVVGIGEHPIDEVLAALEPHYVYDNQYSHRVNRAIWSLFGDALHALGFTPDPTRVPFVLRDASGDLLHAETGTIPPDRYAEWTNWFWPGRMPQRGEQLYLRRNLDDSFWFTALEDEDTLFVQYNLTFATTADGTNMSAFARQVEQALAERSYSRVILDMRHNGGGNNTTYPPLLRVLRQLPEETTLVVMTSRHTYSAAVNLAIDLERSMPVTFVGEPTGGRPNLFSDARSVRLPNSGLVASISSRYWQKSDADDPREAIMPHVVVPVLSDDWFGGRDPALEAALRLVPEDAGSAS